MSLMRGRRGYTSSACCSSLLSDDESAIEAASTMASVTCFARAKIAPNPIPGKMYMLLPCPGSYVFPSHSKGLYGLPDAKMTCPSDLFGECMNERGAIRNEAHDPPLDCIREVNFAERNGIRQGEYDRPLVETGHRPHDLFREGVPDCAQSKKSSRLNVIYYLDQIREWSTVIVMSGKIW
jgi:hypothetical protein